MKTILFLTVFAICNIGRAQQPLQENDLKQYLNKKIEYCNKVFGTYVTKGKNPVTLLNLGDNYPNHHLTVAIFENTLKKFDYKPDEFLKDKIICVSGKLVIYKDKPEIIVENPNQIRIQ